MLAVQYSRLGPPEVLRSVEIPDPVPEPGEVLIRIHAAGLNHGDIHLRRGMPGFPTPLPHIPGLDGAGIIEEVGAGVSRTRIGERVLVNPGLSCGACDRCLSGRKSLCHLYRVIGREMDGTWAEKMKIPASNAIPLPQTLSFVTGACLPVVYLTAWNMVVTQARVRAGMSVLVMAAGSGVGMAAIQLCQLAGAHVIATVGNRPKAQIAKETYGLEHVIAYREEPLTESVLDLTNGKGVDVVIEHVGGDQWLPALRALRRGGTLVTCGATSGFSPQTHLREIYRRQISILGSVMGNDRELGQVLDLAQAGKLVPKIDGTYSHGGASKCHHRMEVGETFGKIVLTF